MGFIKNFDKLAMSPERKIVLELIEEAFAAIQPQKIINETVKLENNVLTIQNTSLDLTTFQHVYIVAFGKGSGGIAKLLEQLLGEKLTGGYVIDVTPQQYNKLHFTLGTHPLPSAENFQFTKTVTQNLSNLTNKDMVIIVTCGGGSVLFEQPHPPLNLEEIIQVNKALLQSGATISEMNAIRKHLSEVKGGGLAKILYPATIFNLMFSDVPGNDMSVIASAPTVKDPTTNDDAWNIFEKYNMGVKVPLSKSHFVETPKDDKYFINVKNVMVLSNETALTAMHKKATELGVQARIYSDKFQGDAKVAWKELIEQTKPGEILLVGGETTVKVSGKGQGGRNQTMVLASLNHLEHGTIFASFDSDGWDFTTLAGAIGDTTTVDHAKKLGVSIDEYLENDDSLPFFQSVGDGIETGRLESNVSDLMIIYKKIT